MLPVDAYSNALMMYIISNRLLSSNTLFARTLSMTFRDSDLIASIGGDEFIVMLINQDAADIPAIMQRLQSTVRACYDKINLELHLSYSYGMAIS
ncbi:MAG: diguanylate cyclase [Methylophaga sp.]|nr:diguanylate cyclase [Methylophaga sp.]